MRFALTQEEAAWQDEVRAFALKWVDAGLEKIDDERRFDPVRLEELTRLQVEFYADLADRGWNSLHWSREYGGHEASAVVAAILSLELEYHCLPEIDWTVSTLAPMLMKHGTQQNIDMWLEKMRRMDVTFCLGYSEAEAGTDLASLRTSAVRDGDNYVINGEKMWQSGAHHQTHSWLCVRTDPSVSKHRGLSIIIVPLDAPGVTIDPVRVWSGIRTNIVNFDNVVVPVANRVGDENDGWKLIVGGLDFERAEVGARVMGRVRRSMDDLISACRSTVRDGTALIDDPVVARQLAELEAEVEIASLLTYEVCGLMDKGETPTLAGTTQKVLATELRTKLTGAAFSLLDLRGQLDSSDPLCAGGGFIEREYRFAPTQRFGGGTNEVMRDVIAQRGLGLVRGAR